MLDVILFYNANYKLLCWNKIQVLDICLLLIAYLGAYFNKIMLNHFYNNKHILNFIQQNI